MIVAIDEILEVFEYRYKRSDHHHSCDYYPLKVYEGLDPRWCNYFGSRIFPEMWSKEGSTVRVPAPWLMRAYDVPKIEVSCISNNDDDDGHVETGYKPYAFCKMRSVGAKAVRGIATKLYPHMVRMDVAFFTDDGTYECIRFHAGSPDGINWFWLGKRSAGTVSRFSDGVHMTDYSFFPFAGHIQVAIAQMVTREFDWTVRLGLDNSPTIDFCTDPVGVRAAFRLRDLPAGKARRAALRHWVTNHYRKKRKDPKALSYVRAHLRGAVDFNWNGLRGAIIPSSFDLRNAKEGILPEPETHADYFRWRISPEEAEKRTEYANRQPEWWRKHFSFGGGYDCYRWDDEDKEEIPEENHGTSVQEEHAPAEL
jgi:hypothetical protein